MTPKHLLLIDLSSIWHAAWHASADQDLSTAYEKTVERVHGFISRFEPAHVAVAVDSPPYTHRKALLPQYKAQRDAPPLQMLEQFARTKARLEADGLLLWASPGFEADDVVSTAVDKALCAGMTVTIVSSDKDLLQLVHPSVRVHSPASDTTYDEAAVFAKFGVHPSKMGDLLALMGDKSDNVPGVEGVGPKKAAALLTQYGTLHDVLANADKNTNADGKPSKLCEALIGGAEAARLARQVIALRADVPIEFKEVFELREVKRLVEQEIDVEEVTEDGEIISSPQQPQKQEALKPFEPPTATEIVRSEPQNWNLGLEPVTLGAAYQLAKGLANSRLYARFPNAEAIWAVIIRGREMGLGALTALDSFHLIEGKPCPSAHLLIARCKAHPDCEYFQFIGGDATYAEYETKNRSNPRPTRLKYTIEQAKTAGLIKPGSNWEKRPDEMLRKSAAVQLGRIEYPDATQGLYAIEEMAA